MEQEVIVTRSVRLPVKVAELLDDLAAGQRRSFSNYVAIVLEDHTTAKQVSSADKQVSDVAPRAA